MKYENLSEYVKLLESALKKACDRLEESEWYSSDGSHVVSSEEWKNYFLNDTKL